MAFDGGTFEGRDGLRGTIAPGGVDWQLARSDGVLDIDAHYLLVTDEDEPIEVRSTGVRKVSAGGRGSDGRRRGRRSDRVLLPHPHPAVDVADRLAWMNDLLGGVDGRAASATSCGSTSTKSSERGLRRPVIVVGAGIGGLATALSLHEIGAAPSTCTTACARCERSASASTSSPTRCASSTRMGLLERVAHGRRSSPRASCTARGTAARSGGSRGGSPPAIRGRSSRSTAACSRRCCSTRSSSGSAPTTSTSATDSCGWTPTTATATATVLDAGDDAVGVTGDAVVAADGIHSVARAQRYPDEGRSHAGTARCSGAASPRSSPVLDGRTMVWAGHRDQKFVGYPIADLPTAARRSTSSPSCGARSRTSARRRGLEPARASSTTSCPSSRTGTSTGSTSPPIIRVRAGHVPVPDGRSRSGGALDVRTHRRCSATPRTRCTRSARTAPRRRSSTRACSPAACAPTTTLGDAFERYERAPAARRPRPSSRPTAGSGRRCPMQLVHERAPDGFDDIDDGHHPRRDRRGHHGLPPDGRVRARRPPGRSALADRPARLSRAHQPQRTCVEVSEYLAHFDAGTRFQI